ncbi:MULTISPECIES: ABC transporter ATP-binding protein [unclassified Microbacterium]|uniref:ABC transporter ATP-binding protein n=1 Tax=unclassified Microbacterium TaxID=2609290 RepID=UPI0012FA5CCB|nr:ATP-binding cassette domain-containing protein [Microbacterium sp. MAH-37]MVQ43784.1 ATP-binding cassette domain-containing protein [Microbacterium sp. MAH-37]
MTLSADFRARVGAFRVDMALDAGPGEVLAILGPNGSGKSTLLAALAGHLEIDDGHVALDGRMLDGRGGDGRAVRVAPAQRRVGLLGQRPLLFPHLSALENVAFGPRAQGVPRAEARTDAASWLDRVGLGDLAGHRPAQLSGGQQQRVALARALAARPAALLLDEPFAALDVETAAQARRLVAEQRDSAGIPLVLVTHDPLDAVVLAARTAIVHDGRIVQQGPTAEVLGHPRSAFVAALAGVNLVAGYGSADGTVLSAAPAGAVSAGAGSTGEGPDLTAPEIADRTGPASSAPTSPSSDLVWRGAGDAVAVGAAATIAFAPGSVRIQQPDAAATTAANTWEGTVATLEPLPGGMRLRTAEQPGIAVDCPSTVAVAAGVAPGVRLRFTVHPDDVSVRRA